MLMGGHAAASACMVMTFAESLLSFILRLQTSSAGRLMSAATSRDAGIAELMAQAIQPLPQQRPTAILSNQFPFTHEPKVDCTDAWWNN